jgi:hypothetical protein
MRPAALLLIWTTAGASSAVAQTVDTRDLTVVQLSTDAPAPRAPGVLFSNQSIERAPLEVKLLDFGRLTYEMYDHFTYSITVRNVGRVPFAVPWERDWGHLVTDSSIPLISCVVSMDIVDEKGKFHSLSGVTLYGSPGSPGTMRTLQPGEAVELILPGKWEFASTVAEQALLGTLPRTVDVVATVAFLHQPPGHYYQRAVSANRFAVNLMPVIVNKQ